MTPVELEAAAEARYRGPREAPDVPWADLTEACREIWRAVVQKGMEKLE